MMYSNGRMASLMARKAQIEAELNAETTARHPDPLRVMTLKRRKLIVKDELQRIERAS